MFTGIVKGMAKIMSIEQDKSGYKLCIDTAGLMIPKLELGNSIAVNGICLTISGLDKQYVFFHISKETVLKTTVREWQQGMKVNIEPALRLGGELGGHFVTGHIDGSGIIVEKATDGVETNMLIKTDNNLLSFIAKKGSVCVDGVSLTVNSSRDNSFAFTLIPWTVKSTNFSFLGKGQKVNIEVDIVARYTAKLLNL